MAAHQIFPKTQELLLFLLSLILSPLLVTADQVSISTSCAAALIVVATVMLLLVAAYIAYYIRRYGNGFLGATTLGSGDMGVPEAEKGMRAVAVEALPSAPFSEIKMGKLAGQVELECAVCLIEFQDAEILRLLPGCCHVFHCECIGPWLDKHVTCPICRADVGKLSGEGKFGALDRFSRGLSEESDHRLTVQIDVSSVSRETNGSLPHGMDRSLGSDTTEEVVVQVTEDNNTRTLPKELCPKSDYRESVGKLKGWNCFSTTSQVDSNSMADSSIHI